MKHLEVKTIEHKGIKITIMIDYDNGLVSLVEKQPFHGSVFQKKQYIFANRGLEYMNGWLNIIEAMQVAIKECKKELEANLAEKSAFKNNKLIADYIEPMLKNKKPKNGGFNKR